MGCEVTDVYVTTEDLSASFEHWASPRKSHGSTGPHRTRDAGHGAGLMSLRGESPVSVQRH